MPPRPRAPKTPEEALSRALAKTLRHAAKQQGIAQDESGWCRIDDMLARSPYNNLGATQPAIFEVVAADKKGRYELSDDKLRIRAVQGHSVPVDAGLVPITKQTDLPAVLVHGTYFAAWPAIQKTGLSKMGRLHIHMATGLPGDSGVISGMRARSEVYIYLNGPKLVEGHVPLLRAANGAILSPGIDGVIPVSYFEKVTDREGNVLYTA